VRGGFYSRAEGQSAEAAGHLQSELFEQLEERGRLVATRTYDGEPKPSGEAIAARTAALVDEPVAAAATLVEDVESMRARGRRGKHRPPATSAEGALPAFVATVGAGSDALVRVAAELADA